MNELSTWLAMYEQLTPEERAEYWRQEAKREQRAIVNGLHEHIELDEWFVQYAKDYAADAKQLFMAGKIGEDELRKRFILAIDVIKGSEGNIKLLRRDVAHYAKYPLGSKKRADYIKQITRRG